MKLSLSKSIRTLLIIWLAWVVIVIGFQQVVTMRLELKRPDRVLMWTANETARNSQRDKPYLMEPFMNHQVAWDSEFYLAIAVGGYDDPAVRVVQGPGGESYSMSYAFFPIYSLFTRVVAFPLRLFGMTAIATATLAGVIVSALGTLGAMLGLYELSKDELGEDGAVRAASYLLIFPTAFFFAQIHTEGLFVGLAFGSLAMLKRRQWVWAALLAALATGTRAVGGLLVIPLALVWIADIRQTGGQMLSGLGDRQKIGGLTLSRQQIVRGLLVLAPIAAYGLWSLLLGTQFRFVEDNFFGRHLLDVGRSIESWTYGLSTMADNSQAAVYYTLEVGATLFALVACGLTLKRYPGLSLFGLLVVIVSLTSGQAQGMPRYVLAVPAMYIVLGRWGKNAAFDRTWSLASILIMGMLATLFTFDFWVG